jgi:primosomal protein N' (replication factor Y)
MFIRVQLLNGLPEPLWYSVPTELQQTNLTGLIVQVPIRNCIIPALVLNECTTKPTNITFMLKDIVGIESLPPDSYYFDFLDALGNYYQQEPHHFIKRIHHFLAHKKEEITVTQKTRKTIATSTNIQLTDEQQKVTDFVLSKITDGVYASTVLHGITGSGKTEIYKQLFLHALALNKTALLLLPEVTLAVAFENRLKEELSDIPFYGFHSGKSPKEKKIVWDNLKNAIPMIIIGVHLPILLPIANLGLIVVDEEHDIGYQEKKHPKINSKHAALIRAQQTQIPILLGSATPSIGTLYNVKTKGWSFFQLKKRFAGSLPTVSIVSLTQNKNRKEFWISKELEAAIQERLKKKEQTIIFINRRGFSFFVQCKQCTFIFMCTDCSVSMTLHEDNSLHCHYCTRHYPLPAQCTACKASDAQFIKRGIGTQRVVSLLQKMFPAAIIARADHDTTTKKKVWQKTIEDMMNGGIDILVGTQTITKGFHFPQVTLVGILWADLQLNFPVYNAVEVALQQLIQVAGRAGRSHDESMVIVQALNKHDVFDYLNEIDYLQFYAHEIAMRKELNYPPHQWFAEIELKHVNEKKLHDEANALANALLAYENTVQARVQILGPAQPPVAKIKTIHSRKIYLRSTSYAAITMLYQKIIKKKYSSSIYFTPMPIG